MRRLPQIAVAVSVVGIGGMLGACSNGQSTSNGPSATVSVFAAASLAEPFGEIAQEYQKEYPSREVLLNFTGSNALATQIIEGAPADVLATADASTMDRVAEEGLVESSTTFASNSMVIITAADNPRAIDGLDSLVDSDVSVALCSPGVPCGDYATEIFDAADVEVEVATLELNVNGVSTKVINGEVDAGIAYATTAAAAGSLVTMIDIPADDNVNAEYLIGLVGEDTPEAEDFFNLVMSEQGQQILADYGFST